MKVFRLYIIFFILFLNSVSSPAQSSLNLKKYWVEFTDKKNTPFCTCRPSEFLSARSIQRRARAGIAIMENDLPVDPVYVSGLRKKGVKIHNISRWLNAATVVADAAQLQGISSLPFVKSVSYLGPHLKFRNPPNRPPKKRVPMDTVPRVENAEQNVYGYANLQNNLLRMRLLYEAGVRGQGIWVAVMDGGFTNTDTLAFFDSVAVAGRLFPGWDFVEGDAGVYEGASHGTSVLSVMASNLPGWFVGTAPDATYFLLKTEDTSGEYPVEEANWVAGAEWADSVGVDIINASLGYISFNDTTLNHRYKTLDGRTAIGSRGAAIAATKGMIVCNSAGNSGDEPWRRIGVPADAPGLIAVGAVTYSGERAGFSSVGPSADGRIKPDLVAPGDQVVTAGYFDADLGISSGTSLASPMLAGALAALWSAFPERPAKEILGAVFNNSDQKAKPDNERGYGLPDFSNAWLELGGFSYKGYFNDARNGLFSFDRVGGKLTLLVFDTIDESDTFRLVDLLNKPFSTGPVYHKNQGVSSVVITGLENLPPGGYMVEWKRNDERIFLWFNAYKK